MAITEGRYGNVDVGFTELLNKIPGVNLPAYQNEPVFGTSSGSTNNEPYSDYTDYIRSNPNRNLATGYGIAEAANFQGPSPVADAYKSGGTDTTKKTTNSNGKTTYNAYGKTFDSKQDLADYNDERKGLMESYNIARDRLLSNLGYLTNSYNSQRGQLADALDSATKSVDTAKENAENYSSRQIGEAADTAKSVQRSNRNTLRALGILSSSAAGELLSKPMNEFDSQRANILEDLKVRKSTLDDYLTEQTNNNARLLSQLQLQYNQQVDNINNDLRFNDNERNSAIRELDKAIRSRIAEVKVAQMQLEQNAQSYTSQLQTAWDKLNSAYTPVTNDAAAINDTSTSKLVDASVNPNTVGLYGDQRKRGLLAGYA